MTKEDLTIVTTEDLKKRAAMMKLAVWAMGIAMVLITTSGIILSLRKGFSALSITGIAFLPLTIIFSVKLKKLNEELKDRN